MGSITETATSFPGQTGQRPNSVAPLAQMLRLNGYSTGAFGKSHETAAWEVSPSGPTDRWPTRSGFDKFYGFLGGETNQWAPMLYDGLNQIEVPKDSELSLHDRHDQSGDWLDEIRKVAHAGQAVLHVLRPGRDARAASRAQRMDRQIQGKVRPGLGQDARGDARPPDQARRRSRRVRSSRRSRRPSRTGTSFRPTKRSCSLTKWRSTPALASTRTARSTVWSRPSRRSARWTTR